MSLPHPIQHYVGLHVAYLDKGCTLKIDIQKYPHLVLFSGPEVQAEFERTFPKHPAPKIVRLVPVTDAELSDEELDLPVLVDPWFDAFGGISLTVGDKIKR